MLQLTTEMKPGLFITFEGSEGCGKSTQIERLCQRLDERGDPFLLLREPGGTAVGEPIRTLLQHTPEAAGMCPESELLLFAASRAQLVREKVAPALAGGTHVIADRFLDSTTAYQGYGRGLPLELIETVNAFAVGDHRPDLTLLFDMDPTEALARTQSRHDGPDRIESEDTAFFERVRDGYLRIAEANPDRFVCLDATLEMAALADSVWQEIQSRLTNAPHS